MAVDAVYHSDWGRIVATLIRFFGDFDLAEEAAQDAFAAAVDQWRTEGVPEFPRAWIVQTARHKAIDRLRRQTRFQEKLESQIQSGLIITTVEPNYETEEIPDDRGPVLVKIEYRIDPRDRERFLRAIDELGEQRRRDGAFAWGVFEDMAELGRFEEAYLIESWLELMHLRERVTNEDRMLEDEISKMLTKPPHIEFLVAAERQPLRRRWRDAAAGA